MKANRFTEEQIIGILQQAEAGAKAVDLCRQHGMGEATFYQWKAKYGGLQVSDAQKLKRLEEENAKLAGTVPQSAGSYASLVDGRPCDLDPRFYANTFSATEDEYEEINKKLDELTHALKKTMINKKQGTRVVHFQFQLHTQYVADGVAQTKYPRPSAPDKK